MELLVYIIVALIPASAVVAVVYLFLKKNGEKEISALSMQLKKERQKFFLEPRIDAYQRIVLLMERLNLQNLVMRLHQPQWNAAQLQANMLDAIRQEFDHNVAQQIFVSTEAWELVKKSKEETIKIIHIAGKQMEPESTSLDLSNKILEIVAEIGELPTEITTKILKEEVQKLF